MSDQDERGPEELDRQVTRGFLHMHTRLSENFANLFEVAATTAALTDLLRERGVLDDATLAERTDQARRDLADTSFARGTSFRLHDDPTDKYEVAGPAVDCEARLPLCKGACCGLAVPLSRQDVEEGIVRWDPGQPYVIRRGSGPYCWHFAEGRCQVREHRPLVCRRYSCATDGRIWKDFEARIPNEEGIADILDARRGPRFRMAVRLSASREQAPDEDPPPEA